MKLKWIGYGLLLIVAVLAVLAYFNWERLIRLQAVNTLFSEALIVSNFSNMDKAFYTVPIPAEGDVEPWVEELTGLPTSFEGPLQERTLVEWLRETQTTSFLVVKDGKIAFEEYYLGTEPDDLRISWSVAKSFLSAAFGVAVSDGLIDLEAEVQTYVPDLARSAYNGATVRNVLNMSSGVRFNEDYLDFWSDINKMGRVLALGGSMDEFSADVSERDREPGTVRQYVSIDTHVLAMVLRSVTGKTIPEYLAEKVLTPVGFEKNPYHLSDSVGNAFALGGLNVTSRDYARFGQLILDRGRWEGRQVIPEDWIAMSTVPSAPAPSAGDGYQYGYQWWIPDGSAENGEDFLARGIYGQYIYVNPQAGIVIVRTAANRKFREVLGDGVNPSHVHVAMFREIAEQLGN